MVKLSDLIGERDLTRDKIVSGAEKIKDFISSKETSEDLISKFPWRYYTIAKKYDELYPGENLEKRFLAKLKTVLKELTSRVEYLKDLDQKVYSALRYHDQMYPDDPWRPEMLSHVVPVGNVFKRMVYVFEFPDNTAYIGLTHNEKDRQRRHQDMKRSPVARYKMATNTQPEFYRLGRSERGEVVKVDEPKYIDAVDAQKLEADAIERYRSEGWKVHNMAPAGALGGMPGSRKLNSQAIRRFLKDTNNDLSSFKLLPGTDYAAKLVKDLGVEKEVFDKIKHIVDKEGIRSGAELRRAEEALYGGRRGAELVVGWNRAYPEDSWSVRLFGTKNTREMPGQGIEAFLANPDNLDRDQLNLITKRSWKQITPDKEKEFLSKVKKIIDKYDLKLIARDTKSGKVLPSGLYVSILNHDKENPDNKWKDILYPKTTSLRESTTDSREIFKQIIKNFLKS